MNSWDWQQVIALLCVAAAAWILGKQTLGWLRGSTCSGCKQCPAAKQPTVIPMNTLKLSPSLQARQSQRPK